MWLNQTLKYRVSDSKASRFVGSCSSIPGCCLKQNYTFYWKKSIVILLDNRWPTVHCTALVSTLNSFFMIFYICCLLDELFIFWYSHWLVRFFLLFRSPYIDVLISLAIVVLLWTDIVVAAIVVGCSFLVFLGFQWVEGFQ